MRKSRALWRDVIGILGISCLLIGCSTDPDSFTYTQTVPEALIGSPPGASDAEAATVRLRREPGFNGFYVDTYFDIDGKRIAKLGQGEEALIRLGPGEYNFGSDCPDVFVPTKRTIVVNVRPKQEYLVRIFPTTFDYCQIETTKVLAQ